MIWDRAALLFGCSLIIAFFSEFFFFNEGPALAVVEGIDDGTVFLRLAELTAWYALAVAPVLWAVQHFRVHTVWGVFLIGAVAGFLIEGLVVPAIYFELPLSLLWVSLSWHPVVDVLLGLWLLQIWLRRMSGWKFAVSCALLGMCWGPGPRGRSGANWKRGRGSCRFWKRVCSQLTPP